MTLEQNKAIARRFHELFDIGDLDGCEALCDPNAVVIYPGVPVPMNRDGFKQLGAMFLAAFSNSQTVIESQIAENDLVATRFRETMTHVAPFQGIPATGKTITISAINIDRIVNGKIVEKVMEWDQLGMLQQLGVIPAQEA